MQKWSWISLAAIAAFLVLSTLTHRPAAAGPEAPEKRWPGLHGEGKPLPSMNLNGTKTEVSFFYHGPDDGKPHLEGRVLKETREMVTVGLSLWKQDLAFSAHDRERKTLEVYLTPRHLQDPHEIRIAILPMTELTAPAGLRAVRVIYLP